jgi:hypothetical protein
LFAQPQRGRRGVLEGISLALAGQRVPDRAAFQVISIKPADPFPG